MTPKEISKILRNCDCQLTGRQLEQVKFAIRVILLEAKPAGKINSERIDQLLNQCGNTWLGGQRALVREAMRQWGDEQQPVVIGQTHHQTMIEVLVGTSIGYVVALMSQVFIMWLYGLSSTFGQDVGITLFFTGISILRGYAVRRYFNWRHHGNTSNRRP